MDLPGGNYECLREVLLHPGLECKTWPRHLLELREGTAGHRAEGTQSTGEEVSMRGLSPRKREEVVEGRSWAPGGHIFATVLLVGSGDDEQDKDGGGCGGHCGPVLDIFWRHLGLKKEKLREEKNLARRGVDTGPKKGGKAGGQDHTHWSWETVFKDP